MRVPWLAQAGICILGAIMVFQGCGKDDSGLSGPVPAVSALTAGQEAAGAMLTGRYIVVCKRPLAKGDAERTALDVAAAYHIQPDYVYTTALTGFAGPIAADRLEALRGDARVRYIEQDRLVSLAGYKREQMPVLSPAQMVPWGVARVGGGHSAGKGTAWIIDTGIDFTHPDLRVDQARSRNFVCVGSPADDDNGHGTHVAGIIGALDNGFGVVGVAPGATLVAVKVIGPGGNGCLSAVIAGINYVAANGSDGDVANISLVTSVSQSLDEAVKSASATVKVTIAAGNCSDFAGNYSPADVEAPNVYTISAFGEQDVFACFSNHGNEANQPIAFSEPGVKIISTYKGGGYAMLSGTSMAAPHAAGLLLLGSIRNGGEVSEDPDGRPDVIGIH